MIEYLNGERKKDLTLSSDCLEVIKWYVGTSFAVHPYFKIHTGAIMNMVQGVIQSVSSKHKMNTSRSTEAELVSVDDASVYIFWTVLFIEFQG